PPDAILTLPGLALAYAMSSGTVLASTDGFNTRTSGPRVMRMTGVPDEIVIELVVERCVDGVTTSDHQERVAVRWRMRDHVGRNIAASTRPVLNNERLAEALG